MNHALGLKQVCALILNSLLPHTARNELWILDFEATDRMTPNLRVFETYKPIISSRKITVANNHIIPIVGQGNVCLNPSLPVQHVHMCLASPPIYFQFINLLKILTIV